MMGNHTITLWNSAGLRASAFSTPAKFNFFDSQFPNAKFSIAAFVETHHKDAIDYAHDFGQYQQTHEILHSPVHNETHSGVIILISKDYEIISRSEAYTGQTLLCQTYQKRPNSQSYCILWTPVGKNE